MQPLSFSLTVVGSHFDETLAAGGTCWSDITSLIAGTHYRDEVKIGTKHWRFSADGMRGTHN